MIGARQVEEWMPAGRRLTVPGPDANVLSRYLQARRISPEAAGPLAWLCARGDSAWLLARLVADTHQQLNEREREELAGQLADREGRPGAVVLLYDRLLNAVGAADPTTWAEQLRPVLTPLAAAGVGPVTPLSLLASASGRFGGPEDPAAVREVLSRLGRPVIRAKVGGDGELAGLFHPTLVEHLAEHARQPVDIVGGHRVLLEEVERLAPVVGAYMNTPLYRWATDRGRGRTLLGDQADQ